MKNFFDIISYETSKMVTKKYSTSFSLATRMLGVSIRQDIYNIYGFVRFADEIVDSFHGYDQDYLFHDFERQLYEAIDHKISLNPILNSFQETVHTYNIDRKSIEAFMKSMRLDLQKIEYTTDQEYHDYIYGSADVVGLMCLQVFVKGDKEMYNELKDSAMRLGSAFQKVNFLRDLKQDFEQLGRTYFPNANLKCLDKTSKDCIIKEIEEDFKAGYEGIKKLPAEAKFGVFTAYRYYKQLLKKLDKIPASEIKNSRVRISNFKKLELLTRSYAKYQLKLIK